MIDKLSALDRRIIDFVQTAYLWLWDRTGIFAGVVLFVMGICTHFAGNKFRFDFDFAISALLPMAWGGYMVYLQGRGLRLLNRSNRVYAESPIRKFIAVTFLGLVIGWTARGDLIRTICAISALIYTCYLPAIQIRDREPPEKHVFAPESSR